MDAIDLAILRAIQTDNRRAAAELSPLVGLSISATGERLRRLNASGAIVANRAVIAPRHLGLALLVFMFVDLATGTDEEALTATLATLPEVQEAHHVTGVHSWLLKIRVRDTAALQALMNDHLKHLPGVLRTETLVALATGKETTELAIPPPGEAPP